MRDVHTEPITKQEILACLDELAREIADTHLVGSLRPLLLRAAMEIVAKSNYGEPALPPRII